MTVRARWTPALRQANPAKVLGGLALAVSMALLALD
jgi:hypothetical protein